MITIAAIAAAMQPIAVAITGTSKLFSYIGSLMDSAEAAFKGAEQTGTDKKTAVLAGLAAIATQIGADYDEVKDNISSYIDVVKAAYNAVKDEIEGNTADAAAQEAVEQASVDKLSAAAAANEAAIEENQRSK